jgi:formate hydrogenlyase subunit 3/multisubunit Na+/H+ antiporter MnhD subunit
MGVITFLLANLMGLKQTDDRRMLGYSSVAQIGLVSAAFGLIHLEGLSGTYLVIVAGGLLVNHLLAKAGLFWIAGAGVESGDETTPGATSQTRARRGIGPIAGIGVVVLGLALVGLPPFPGFWAKWQLVNTLVATGRIAILVMILAGTLFEAIYILRWVGRLIARPEEQAAGDSRNRDDGAKAIDAAPAEEAGRLKLPAGTAIGTAVLVLLVGAVGVFTGWYLGLNDRVIAAIFGFTVVMLLLEWLPSRIKGAIAIVAIGGFAWLVYPRVSGIALIFGAVFAAGGILAVVASLHRKLPFGTYTFYVLAATGLTGLDVASEPITFFVVWELMTIGGYLLIARSSRAGANGEGIRPPRAATQYIAFSIGGALLIMVGLVLALQGTLTASAGAVSGSGAALPELFGADGYVLLPALTGGWPAGASGAAAGGLAAWAAGIPAGTRIAVFILMGLGFLVKVGAMVVHIWLPDAYAEADNEVTSLLSSSVSKAGVFGIILLLVMIGAPVLGGAAGGTGVGLNAILGWVGALTALFGALLAAFQEDVKRLLAYSSVSQVGYMVLGLSLATHLGWVAGIYLAVLHFVFKGILFIAMTGVINRSGTRYMYEMGGLIKRMPLTFIAVLMSIIAVSGVPPLAGFGGKWLIYGALMESGWWVQTGVAFFASTIAFLYLYRMIQTVFLGQLKDNLREVKEAPLPILIPMVILMGALMAMSMYPNLILKPIMGAIEPYLASTVQWDNYTVITALGYWNGNLVMYVTMGVFIVPLAWLIIVMRRPQKVKQFNIVYAAERPSRPETTHFAHNFFAPYRKALGFLAAPAVSRAWRYVSEGVLAIGGTIRQLYTGNGQTYALHILLLTVVLYLVTGGI